MRIPPKVEKHNLDLEWPDTAMGKRALPCGLQLLSSITHGGSSDSKDDIHHAAGPYIDFKLSNRISTTRFEAAVLRHFEVLNTTS